jgi:hypothetical protein
MPHPFFGAKFGLSRDFDDPRRPTHPGVPILTGFSFVSARIGTVAIKTAGEPKFVKFSGRNGSAQGEAAPGGGRSTSFPRPSAGPMGAESSPRAIASASRRQGLPATRQWGLLAKPCDGVSGGTPPVFHQ